MIEKGKKRRGKEEDSDITGGIYSEDMTAFLKNLVKSRKFYRIDTQSIRCLYIVFHEKKAPIADVCCARFLKYNQRL